MKDKTGLITKTKPAKVQAGRPELRHKAEQAAEVFRQLFPDGERPAFFIQTGSGFRLDGLLDSIAAETSLDQVPGMPGGCSPAGHPLRLVSGWCGKVPLLVCEGRRHLYEGQGTQPCVLPVCAAGLAGIPAAIFLSAAGGVNSDYRPGTVMVLTDFINHLGTSPLVGLEPLGVEFFPAMNDAYSPRLTSDFLNATAESPVSLRVGIYQANLGPQYETPAEVDIARRNGADAVGMSTVLETIAARALNMEVLGLALITNGAASVTGGSPAHVEVQNIATEMSPEIMNLLTKFITGRN